MSAKVLWDRREVLAVSLGAAAVAYLPFGALTAAPAAGAAQTPLADWSIDDQWGVYPRWDAIPCSPPRAFDDAARLASVEPANLPFVPA